MLKLHSRHTGRQRVGFKNREMRQNTRSAEPIAASLNPQLPEGVDEITKADNDEALIAVPAARGSTLILHHVEPGAAPVGAVAKPVLGMWRKIEPVSQGVGGTGRPTHEHAQAGYARGGKKGLGQHP
jgi:hypothetical protein